MLTGIANGGPRDGVKLTCPPSWNGLIKRPATIYTRSTYDPKAYYPGYYVWSASEWVWIADPKGYTRAQ